MTAKIIQSIPFSPNYMSFEDWNGNFVQWYGREPLPINTEENWKDTAYQIMALPTFAVYPVPSPDGFETWQDWANVLTESVNGPTK
jgi:hypothetical protein